MELLGCLLGFVLAIIIYVFVAARQVLTFFYRLINGFGDKSSFTVGKERSNNVHQKGSNITAERLRFDFSHGTKMTDEEKEKVENLVNEYINQDIEVERLEMKKDDALKLGAEAMFLDKYGDEVTVYKIGDVSLELCGGPHVKRTGELGKFKIKKEEASSSGVRRIKAILE